MKVFFLVLARDDKHVARKIEELNNLGVPYLIVCGNEFKHPNVVFREPHGKYDAINFGLRFVPSDTDVVAFNDVDTEIHNLDVALELMRNSHYSLVFAKVEVKSGPQLTFYAFLDFLRKRIPIAASGELMLVRYSLLKEMIPLKGCKAEDSYILFKTIEKKGKVFLCEECYVTTTRTTHAEQEEDYKRRTVGGIYQALSMTNPPISVRIFYKLLPLVSPLLLIMGRKGYYWTKGILLGYLDCLRGDKTPYWQPIS